MLLKKKSWIFFYEQKKKSWALSSFNVIIMKINYLAYPDFRGGGVESKFCWHKNIFLDRINNVMEISDMELDIISLKYFHFLFFFCVCVRFAKLISLPQLKSHPSLFNSCLRLSESQDVSIYTQNKSKSIRIRYRRKKNHSSLFECRCYLHKNAIFPILHISLLYILFSSIHNNIITWNFASNADEW